MKLLARYVARQFLATFFSLLLGLPLLFVIIDVTENLDKYLGRGLPFRDVATAYLYQLPQFFQWAFPIAALVGTVFTIGNMTRHQEIAAAKAGGISFHRLIVPLVLLGILLSGAALALGELVPVTNAKQAELLGDQQFRQLKFRSDFVFQTEKEGVLSVRQLDSAAQQMSDVLIERGATAEAPGVHQMAERAEWTPEQGWRLQSGYIRFISADDSERTFAYESALIPALAETPEDLLAEPKDPEEMRYSEMSRFIEAIERSGGDARGMLVARAQKISLPVAVLVIILFGAPLATSSRRGGAAFGIGISLVVTMVYLLLFRVGSAVGESGTLDPVLAAWLPNLIFSAGALFLLVRVRT